MPLEALLVISEAEPEMNLAAPAADPPSKCSRIAPRSAVLWTLGPTCALYYSTAPATRLLPHAQASLASSRPTSPPIRNVFPAASEIASPVIFMVFVNSLRIMTFFSYTSISQMLSIFFMQYSNYRLMNYFLQRPADHACSSRAELNEPALRLFTVAESHP
jgi:hypothetical protein